MKKVLVIVLALLMLVALFAGCGPKAVEDAEDAGDGGESSIKIGFSLSTLGNAFFV